MQVVLQQYTRLGPLHFFQMPKASLAPTLVGPLVGWSLSGSVTLSVYPKCIQLIRIFLALRVDQSTKWHFIWVKTVVTLPQLEKLTWPNTGNKQRTKAANPLVEFWSPPKHIKFKHKVRFVIWNTGDHASTSLTLVYCLRMPGKSEGIWIGWFPKATVLLPGILPHAELVDKLAWPASPALAE